MERPHTPQKRASGSHGVPHARQQKKPREPRARRVTRARRSVNHRPAPAQASPTTSQSSQNHVSVIASPPCAPDEFCAEPVDSPTNPPRQIPQASDLYACAATYADRAAHHRSPRPPPPPARRDSAPSTHVSHPASCLLSSPHDGQN